MLLPYNFLDYSGKLIHLEDTSKLNQNCGLKTCFVRNYKTHAFSEYNEAIVIPECMRKDQLLQVHEKGGLQDVTGVYIA